MATLARSVETAKYEFLNIQTNKLNALSVGAGTSYISTSSFLSRCRKTPQQIKHFFMYLPKHQTNGNKKRKNQYKRFIFFGLD